MISRELRLILFATTDHRCFYCGLKGNLTVDHIIPKSKGGTSSLNNLLPACRKCNRQKSSMTVEEFRQTFINRGIGRFAFETFQNPLKPL